MNDRVIPSYYKIPLFTSKKTPDNVYYVPVVRAGVPNLKGSLYSTSVLEAAIAKYTQDRIVGGTALGQLEFPDVSQARSAEELIELVQVIDSHRVSHEILDLGLMDGDLIAKIHLTGPFVAELLTYIEGPGIDFRIRGVVDCRSTTNCDYNRVTENTSLQLISIDAVTDGA